MRKMFALNFIKNKIYILLVILQLTQIDLSNLYFNNQLNLLSAKHTTTTELG